MEKEVTLVFHNQGLRSYIELDLCAECPRQDDKGCCGYYSPVFYPLDLAYILTHKADLIDYIFDLDDITVLDSSVTVNNNIEGKSYRCKFHSKETGCILSQDLRESVCRHFVCPGISWWKEDNLHNWNEFFNKLTNYEIQLNDTLSTKLTAMGLNLREPALRPRFFEELLKLYTNQINKQPAFFHEMPECETVKFKRHISFGEQWPL